MIDTEKLEKELANANSIEEVQEILKNNGAEMTLEEIQKMLNELAPQGELAEDDLDAVAGGLILPRRGLGLLLPLGPLVGKFIGIVSRR